MVMAVAPAIVGGSGGVYNMQRRVARPVVESVKVGDDEWQQNQAMKLAYSECSGEDNVVEVASVDEEGARDLVKTVVGIKRSRKQKG